MCVRIDRTMKITEEIVRAYSLLSGDENPIHLDLEEARKSHFSKPVAHGMLVMGLSAQILNELGNKGSYIRDYEMNFLNPVFVNDSVQFLLETEQEANKIKISGNVNGNIVIKGRLTMVGSV